MKWWMIVLFILFILAVLGSMIIFPQNPAHNLILQYISTLASWPLIIFILGLVLLIKYKEPISEWIKTLFIKTPKGYVFGTTAQSETKPLEKGQLKEVKKKLIEQKRTIKSYTEFVHFERIIRQMYRSQYKLLKNLKVIGSIANDTAILYYYDFLSQGGNKDYKITSYMKWLRETIGLIKISRKMING